MFTRAARPGARTMQSNDRWCGGCSAIDRFGSPADVPAEVIRAHAYAPQAQ